MRYVTIVWVGLRPKVNNGCFVVSGAVGLYWSTVGRETVASLRRGAGVMVCEAINTLLLSRPEATPDLSKGF